MNIPADKLTKLLIVYEDSSISDVLKDCLSEFLLVKLATIGEDAIRILTNWKHDLILLDLVMPDIDGLTTGKTIRSQVFRRHISIIMITALSCIAKRKAAFNTGLTLINQWMSFFLNGI